MNPDLAALMSTVATTVVTLLATAAWEQAKTAIVGIWRSTHPQRAETVGDEPVESRAQILLTRQAGDEQALIDEWRGRLRRLVTTDPQLAHELRRVVAELQPLPPDAAPQFTTITMQATTWDDSRAYQVGHDLCITER